MGSKRFRAKKRKQVKFSGNQFTQKAVNKEDAYRTNEGTPPSQTSRPRPVLPQEDDNRNESTDNQHRLLDDEQFDLNFIIYLPVLKLMFSEFSRCQVEGCNSSLTVNIELSKKNGLCHTLEVLCPTCGFVKPFKS